MCGTDLLRRDRRTGVIPIAEIGVTFPLQVQLDPEGA